MKKSTYNSLLALIIRRHLDARGLAYDFDKEEGCFQFSFSVPSDLKEIYFLIMVRPNGFITYSSPKQTVDVNDPLLMARMSEFVERVNHGMPMGCFELDWDEGNIWYRMFTDCSRTRIPDPATLDFSLDSHMVQMEVYAPGMLEILSGNTDTPVRDIVTKCESESSVHQALFFRLLCHMSAMGSFTMPEGALDQMEDEDPQPKETAL